MVPYYAGRAGTCWTLISGVLKMLLTFSVGAALILDWFAGGVLDAISWHTYDYRSTELGGLDHHPMP